MGEMLLDSFNQKKIWQGAILLTVAALITKILSAAYRIPYQNIAGDIGFYVYQQVYPIYGIALILSIYGFPVVISKLISENNGDKLYVQKIAVVSFYALLLFGVFTSVLLFLFAKQISNIMADNLLVIPLQVTAFSFLMVPFLSIFRGYHQGNGNMTPTAVSQITEQFLRVFLILFLAYLFIVNGFGPYGAGTGAAIGSVVGAIVGVVVLFVYFIKMEKLSFFQLSFSYCDAKQIVTKLFRDSVLICFSALVFVLFQLVDAITIVRLLQDAGVHEQIAKVSKGIFDRGQPLIQLGTVVTTAFSLALVPLIASAIAKGETKEASIQAELSLRLSFMIGLSAAVGLIIIIEPTNAMLFTDRSDSHVLAVLGSTIAFSAIVMTTAAILQGYGHLKAPALHVCIGVFIKYGLNIILIPSFGTLGAAIATVVAFSIICGLNIWRILKIKGISLKHLQRYYAVIFSTLIMAVFTYIYKTVMERTILLPASRMAETILALSSVTLGAAVFLFCILYFQSFTPKEIELLPKGDKLNKIFRKLSKKE